MAEETVEQKALREAEEARKKAEKDLQTMKDEEARLKREKEEKELKDKNDYAALIIRVEAERTALAEQTKKGAIDNELTKLSLKAGLKKDDYLRLLDRSTVTYENGVVSGADKAVEKFKKDSPELFGGGKEEDGTTGGSTKIPRREGQPSFVDEVIKNVEANRKARLPIGWKKA